MTFQTYHQTLDAAFREAQAELIRGKKIWLTQERDEENDNNLCWVVNRQVV